MNMWLPHRHRHRLLLLWTLKADSPSLPSSLLPTTSTEYKNARKQTDRSKAAGKKGAHPSHVAIDDLAAVMVSKLPARDFNSFNASVDGFSNSVEVVSVASSVSTRAAAASVEREDNIVQFASIFAVAPQTTAEKSKEGEGIDDEESMYS
jgi:hypothetical protein